jgi:small subunit ribosomal protein S1
MAEKEALDLSQLEKEIDKSFGQIEEGALIEGTIIQVDNDFAYLDVGLKSEGKIPLSEFKTKPAIGEKVKIVLENKEGKHGEIIISKRKADYKFLLQDLKNAYENKIPVEGKIVKVIKGGYSVDLGSGLTAFLPVSKVDINRVEKAEDYIGLESLFYIDRLSENRGKLNIVVTRRDYLLEQSNKNRDDFFEHIKVGDEVEGVVKSFTSFGAFVDLGGFDGLLHLNDMSWGHATRPRDYVKKDEKIKLKVARLDPENKRINLSLKHFQEDPWIGFHERYNVNDVVAGHVTKLTDFGAFVEIEEGIEGLVHISELSWVKRIKHPKEVLSIGDAVSVVILGYDTEAERISLGLKQAMENPWDSIGAKYPVGTKIKRPIKKVTNAGAFIELEEGIDAFLHADDISWTKRSKNANSLLKSGEEIETVVIDVVPEEHRIRLGIKQLSDDPWKALEAAYHRGEIQEGEVTGKTEFGIFVRVSGGLEGLIHRNNLTEDKTANVDEIMASINVGDKIKATIIEISPEKKRLALSVRDLKIREQQKELHKYMDDEDNERGSTLGDFLSNSSEEHKKS